MSGIGQNLRAARDLTPESLSASPNGFWGFKGPTLVIAALCAYRSEGGGVLFEGPHIFYCSWPACLGVHEPSIFPKTYMWFSKSYPKTIFWVTACSFRDLSSLLVHGESSVLIPQMWKGYHLGLAFRTDLHERPGVLSHAPPEQLHPQAS